MGVWGTALYSGDFAMDLRGTIGAVARLPFKSGRLVEILCETEPSAATNPDDEDHSTFWLVVADQFAKRGIVSDQARDMALKIIDSGSDLAMLIKLEMSPSDLKKRAKTLVEVRARVATPIVAKPRNVLKKPQPLLMEVGDAFVYPIHRREIFVNTAYRRIDWECINPYFASKARSSHGGAWTQEGWAACVILDRGRAFDFLSWYRPLVARTPWIAEKPSLETLRGEALWMWTTPGTCSAQHFKRMELEKLGRFVLDAEKLRRIFPAMSPGTSAAVSDISIANRLNIMDLSVYPEKPQILPNIQAILVN
jgi:hypothetical protein